ncbi:MAG: aminoglycoside phosphotransferase family protein [Chloroflexota bacterium]
MIASIDHLLDSVGMRRIGLPVPLPGGGNNRLLRVETAQTALVAKSYFVHPGDPRDRMATEVVFSRFAWQQGIHTIPRPVADDPGNHLALYELLPGRRPTTQEIDQHAVGAAMAFFTRLNAVRDDAASLPEASEACFSIAQHLERVAERVARLSMIDDPAAQAWVAESLTPAWQTVLSISLTTAQHYGIDLNETLSMSERCVSPSDFGFHNALRDDGGSYWFLDFEYAGWDDPAKVACDFFCQPERPVPSRYYAEVVGVVSALNSQPRRHAQRIALLWPAYQLKWACIVLNEFLPIARQRRAFAGQQASLSRHTQRLGQSKRLVEGAWQASRRLAAALHQTDTYPYEGVFRVA